MGEGRKKLKKMAKVLLSGVGVFWDARIPFCIYGLGDILGQSTNILGVQWQSKCVTYSTRFLSTWVRGENQIFLWTLTLSFAGYQAFHVSPSFLKICRIS